VSASAVIHTAQSASGGFAAGPVQHTAEFLRGAVRVAPSLGGNIVSCLSVVPGPGWYVVNLRVMDHPRADKSTKMTFLTLDNPSPLYRHGSTVYALTARSCAPVGFIWDEERA